MEIVDNLLFMYFTKLEFRAKISYLSFELAQICTSTATILAKSPWDMTTLSYVFTSHLKPTRFDAIHNFKLPPSPHSILKLGHTHNLFFNIQHWTGWGKEGGAFDKAKASKCLTVYTFVQDCRCSRALLGWET